MSTSVTIENVDLALLRHQLNQFISIVDGLNNSELLNPKYEEALDGILNLLENILDTGERSR